MQQKTKKGIILISVGIEVALVSTISWETAVVASAVGFIVLGLYELSYFGNKAKEEGALLSTTGEENLGEGVLNILETKKKAHSAIKGALKVSKEEAMSH